MKILSEKKQVRNLISEFKIKGKKISFVPTMGALHEGHLSLIKLAKKKSDIVVTSVFVNPRQFGKNEDLNKYPRNIDRDIDLLQQENVDILYSPKACEVYSDDFINIDVGKMGNILEGEFRPDFFSGVALIVIKLFNIVNPDIAVFGSKDYQQLCIIKQLVKELDFDIEILKGEIVRENSGLAMSSRNQYLSNDDKKLASSLYKILNVTKDKIKKGTDIKVSLKDAKEEILGSGFDKIDYLKMVDVNSLEEVRSLPAILLVAANISNTRLIDNIFID